MTPATPSFSLRNAGDVCAGDRPPLAFKLPDPGGYINFRFKDANVRTLGANLGICVSAESLCLTRHPLVRDATSISKIQTPEVRASASNAL